MSLSLHSLSSQKKGAIQSLVLLAAVAMLVVGILSVSGARFTVSQSFTPLWSQVSASNSSINITITNHASSPAAIKRVDFTRPSTVANFECGPQVPSGWTCSRGSATVVTFQNSDGVAAGSSVNFNLNITVPASGGNYSFDFDTFENTGGTVNLNSSKVNASVDADFPYVRLVNISDGTSVLTATDTTGSFFLANTSTGLRFVINATDNSSGIGRVAIYYNISNGSALGNNMVQVPDHQGTNGTNVSSVVASNGSYGLGNMFNVTLNDFTLKNGSRIAFTILANDTAGAGNGNVSNSSNATAVSTFAYNFTIDSVPPQFVDVQIANQSLNASTARAINITNVLTSRVEHIINSSLVLNVTAFVRDDGGSGTVKVEVMDRSGTFMNMALLMGTNGTSTQTVWNISQFNITELVKGFAGDGLYNITFRATDNVSNQNATYNFSVEVDDAPPTGSVITNLTIGGGILSPGNVTSIVATNSSFNITVITVGNINNNTDNVSVVGNLGNNVNLSSAGGTPSGTSFWSVTVENNTLTNLSTFCNHSDVDGKQCNINVRFSDVMGRANSSVNLTIVSDALTPNVSILSPASLTTNYTGTVLINVSVNDSVGPFQNVSFRWVNDTKANAEGQNYSKWIPMSLGAGNNNQFNAQGYWNYTLDITTLVDGNYSVEINATDSAGRQNSTVSRTQVVFDSTRPFNISITRPGTNSFHRDNTTLATNASSGVLAVANETTNSARGVQSGLFNVSFRLENSTHTSPWVPSTFSNIQSASNGIIFAPNRFNITHIGEQLMNATNSNFTLRLNVTDTAGNQNTSITVNVTIDTVVPYGISFVYPGNNQNQSAGFTVNLSVTNESNINTVQYRWENATYVDGTSVGANVSDWINMNNQGGPNNWNATFNMTGLNKTDGNYTIAINVTDKAGNQNVSALGNSNNSAFVQLLLDQSRPEVVYVGSLSSSQQTNDFVVNMTTKDNRSFINDAGLFNVSNINATAFRLENSTFNGSYQNISFATTDLGNVANANRTNVTFEFTSVANGNYNIRFWVNDTAGNQNNSVVVSNITLDNRAASMTFDVNNFTPSIDGAVGVSGNVAFNVSVTDNIPLNISVNSNTTVQGNTYGVFYRFESSTLNFTNGSWLPMSTSSFQDAVISNSSGRAHTAIYNATNTTIALADGDYTIRINVTDRAGNQNTSQTVGITLQNGGSKVRAVSLTFQGGIFNGFANSSTDAYTFLMNTTANATCRYSLDTAITYYDNMTSTMLNNVSRAHSISFGPFRDVAASGHTLYYACKDVGGNFTAAEGAASQFPFGIDTRNRYNITVPGKTDNKWPNYLQAASAGAANGWSSFTLSTLTLSDTTLNSTGGGYNVTNVLSSLLQGTAAGNFTRIYAYNASTDTFQSFRVGQTGNSFINFSDESEYWINVTQIERIEIR